ncbi:hypothetical protein HMI54_014696 [Coelomomyces lativittatus]|nr:hypothetical protein HMI56_003262 [Coelomomyces lativittatus]KAJ1513771.1 hypothetical protein HMI54_014696 [Coelomomyces lativittatus]KAJ1514821.1 hypothetical protein HMI55_004318 [Coelomomyces lativittatus]
MPRWLDTDLLQDALMVQWHPRLPFLLTATSSALSIFSSSGECLNSISFPTSHSTSTTLLPTSIVWHTFRQSFACGFSDGSILIWMNGKLNTISSGSPYTEPIVRLAWTTESCLVTIDAAGLIWVWQIQIPSLHYTKLHEFRSPEPTLLLLDLDTKQHDLTLVTLHHLIGLNISQSTSAILFSVNSSSIVHAIHQFHSNQSWYLILCENGQLNYLSIMDDRVASSQQMKIGMGISLHSTSSMNWSMCWVGQSIAAICNGSNILRMVDFIGDDSTSISLDAKTNGKISTLSFDQIRNRLAAGTDVGHILLWQSKAQYLKDENRIGRTWQLQPMLNVNAPLSQVSFHPFYALILALRQGQLRIFLEHSDVVAFSNDSCCIQTSLNTLQLIKLAQDSTPYTLPTSSIQIQKIIMDSYHVLVWNTKFIQLWNIEKKEWTPAFPHNADFIYIYESHLLLILSHQILVCDLHGKSEHILESIEDTNTIVQTCFQSPYLAWITKETQLSIFHLEKDQFVLQQKKLNPSLLLYVTDMAINVNGNYVAFIAKSSESVFSSRVWIYFCEKETLVGSTENEQPSRLFWDRLDPRILAVECNLISTLSDEENTYINTYFVAPHMSPSIQKYTQETLPVSKVVFIEMPYVYFLPANDPKLNKQLHSDFIQLESQVMNRAFVNGMLNFRDALMSGNTEAAFHLIPVKSKSIWMTLCHMCIKTEQLEAALMCLGHAGHAVGCHLVRSVHDDIEKLGLLAEYTKLSDVAQQIYTRHQRWDLLARLQAATKQWELAFQTVRQHDRVHLKRMHLDHGDYLEKLGFHDAAIKAYEQSDAISRIPQILLTNPIELEKYLKNSKSTELSQWYAQYKESKGCLNEAISWYVKSKDILSAVRLYCYLGQMNEAKELAENAQHSAANYFLAQHYEKQMKIKDAVAHYAKAQCFSHAVGLAKQHKLMDDLMHLALRCRSDVQLEVAQFYIASNNPSMAIPLLLRAGEAKQALKIACEFQFFDKILEIAKAIVPKDPALLHNTVEFLILHQYYLQAIEILVFIESYAEALSLCVEKNIMVTETWAASMPPMLVAEACMAQHQYALACKKFTMAGDKLNAMKALIQLGDIDQILYFAGMSGVKNKDIYILAANYLQSKNWKDDPDLLKHIITFYTKAKAFDHLSRFFETCAQVEVDEYSNYKKALGGLKEAHKCATQSNLPSTETRLIFLDRKMDLIEKFTNAQQAAEKNEMNEALQLCAALLSDSDIEIAVRIGDIYAFLIETHVQNGMMAQVQEIYERMKNAVPLRQIPYFLEEPLLKQVDPNFYTNQTTIIPDEEIVEEEEEA